MQDSPPPNKVLVAVDGSEQSLRAIRYAAAVFSPRNTHIVLFHVQAQLFDLFSDMGAYPHYKRRMTGIKRWASDRKMDISSAMDSAVVYFRKKGFADTAITVKTPPANLGITQDIIRESYAGYQAIVVGRTGSSRFKDWLIKSTAMKLVAKIQHIPVVVVGGNPAAENFMVAFDGTHGAMKGVVCVGALLGPSSHRLQLFSMIGSEARFWPGDSPDWVPSATDTAPDTGAHPLGGQLAEAHRRLLEEGIAPDQISMRAHIADRDKGSCIVEQAERNQFGSVVVGRRALITFIDEYFVGRVSDQVLKHADKLAVWVL